MSENIGKYVLYGINVVGVVLMLIIPYANITLNAFGTIVTEGVTFFDLFSEDGVMAVLLWAFSLTLICATVLGITFGLLEIHAELKVGVLNMIIGVIAGIAGVGCILMCIYFCTGYNVNEYLPLTASVKYAFAPLCALVAGGCNLLASFVGRDLF